MSSVTLDSLAVCLCGIAAATFYLGCPNQQWLPKRPLGFYPMAAIACALLIPGWILFRAHMSVLSASFTVLTVTMLCLSLLPLLTRFEKPLTNDSPKKSTMDKSESAEHYRARWWLRIIGSLVLAFPLAVTITGLLAYLGPGGLTNDVKTQLAMWLITPLFLLPLSLVFFAKSAFRALSILFGLNLLASSLLWYLRAGV